VDEAMEKLTSVIDFRGQNEDMDLGSA